MVAVVTRDRRVFHNICRIDLKIPANDGFQILRMQDVSGRIFTALYVPEEPEHYFEERTQIIQYFERRKVPVYYIDKYGRIKE